MASALCALLGVVVLAAPAVAETRRLALVLGFGEYTAVPALPICVRSADAVSAAFQKLGFEVTEVRNASNGAVGAALAGFARRLADPPAFAALYACGYVTGFDGRPFLLPVSAELSRPSDVLTQGLLAKSLLDLFRAGDTPALAVLDATPAPGSGPSGIGFLIHGDGLRPNLFVAGAVSTDPAPEITPLSAALIAAIGAPDADAAGVLAALQSRLAAAASLAIAGSAPQKALLTPPQPAPVAPAPAAPPAPPPAQTQPAQTQPVQTQPAQTQPAAPPPAAARALDDGERRRVQAALKQLGLYPGPVDGVFGPATVAAVRRFQTVRGVDPTGQLDSAQATLLLALVAKAP